MRVLAQTPVGGLSRVQMIDELAALERLAAAAAARQARLAVAFEAAERQAQAAAGVAAARRGEGIAAQIGLARRMSPTRAAIFLGHARTLCLDLPETMRAHVAGELSEHRAGLIAGEVRLLDAAARANVDRHLHAGRYGGPGLDATTLSDARLRAEVRAEAYRQDPTIVLKRGRHAATERYVSLRPAPDIMSYLTGYLPAREGVACLAALSAAADSARAAGDERSRGQVMADTLVARITGAAHPGEIKTELHLILTDQDLLDDAGGPAQADCSPASTVAEPMPAEAHATATATAANGDGWPDTERDPWSDDEPEPTPQPGRLEELGRLDEPGFLVGYGPVPAPVARQWLRESFDAAGRIWIRRLFTDPPTGQVRDVDGRARPFPARIARLILARDRYCRTPFCGAPIRHLDHAHPRADGGPGDAANGQGLCERCNQAKTAPGWSARSVADPMGLGRHIVRTTTPTGTVYESTAPPVTKPRPRTKPGGSEQLPRAG